MTHTCETCRFGHFAPNQVDGECRHKSPCWSGLIERPMGRFPMVGVQDWCGDWSHAEAANDAGRTIEEAFGVDVAALKRATSILNE
jgi:hypothetical protein